jgi:hypothetical protein
MSMNPIEVQKALKGASYPSSRDELAQLAESNGSSDVAEALRNSSTSEFGGPDDVMQAVKGELGGS